ncbi:MAG: flagellar motor protein [Cellulosilyticaceae bacterium]
MDLSIIIFLLFSFGALIGAFILEGGHFMALFIGTAALIVFGGTIGAIGISFPLEELKKLPKIFGVLFKYKPIDEGKVVVKVFGLATEARQEGLLALEKHINGQEKNERLIKKGLALVIDGVETEQIRKTLEADIDNIAIRHEIGISMFEAAGGYSPTMGIIGTVMGLVHVLGNLEDPSTLGPKIAVAFIATLYGVATANIVWLPIGARLKTINEKEVRTNQMIIEGIIGLQQGKNPKLIAEDMCSFLEPKARAQVFGTLKLGDQK